MACSSKAREGAGAPAGAPEAMADGELWALFERRGRTARQARQLFLALIPEVAARRLHRRLDFLGKLAALIPPPRRHQLRFHGIYAPNAGLRSQVIPERPVEEVCSIDVLACPRCGSRMQTIAFLMAAEPIRKILTSIGFPADSPRLYSARALEEVYELDDLNPAASRAANAPTSTHRFTLR